MIDWNLKIAALLHDPLVKVLNIPRHERIASRTMEVLFGSEVASLLHVNEIKKADAISSSIDRLPLSIALRDEYIRDYLRQEEIKLKNPIWPEFEHRPDIPPDWEERYWNFVQNIANTSKNVKDPKARYLLFYLLYEKLFLNSGLPTLPADTRVPTYSVLDHVYASTTAINVVNGGKLILLDIPGTQGFIGASRKLRDLWISSYLVSALMWYVVLEDIFQFGPDVLVMPSPRLNPFLAHSLRAHLQVPKVVEQQLREIESGEVFGSRQEIYDALQMPIYPVIPGKATIILPRDADRDENFYISRLEEGWVRVWNAVERLSELRKDRSLIWAFIHRVLQHYRERWMEVGEVGVKFHITPPLGLRVSIIEFEPTGWASYDEAYSRAFEKMWEEGKRREAQESKLFLEALTEESLIGVPESSKRGFDYCTVCGRLPALVIMPKDEDLGGIDTYSVEVYNFVYGQDLSPSEVKKKIEEQQLQDEINSLKVLFKPGERLCPWCFIKRVLSLEPRLLKVLLSNRDVSNIVAEIAENPMDARFFPSTAHIAASCFFKYLSEINRFHEIEWVPGIPAHDIWALRRELSKSLKEPKLSFLYVDPEELILDSTMIKKILYPEDVKKFGKTIWRYYALLMADTDNMGMLIRGDLRAVCPHMGADKWQITKRYLIVSAEGRLKEIMRRLLEVAEGEAEIDQYLIKLFADGKMAEKEAKAKINEILKVLKNIKNKGGLLPLTISYHTTVSSILMRAAMRDIREMTKLDGIVVYSGGDDLLAIMPLYSTLDFVHSTRRSFAGLDDEPYGFTRIGDVIYPMMPGPGRSYAIAVAHYRYPLSDVYRRLHEALDEAKDNAVFSVGGKNILKDLLVVFRIPGYMESLIPISTKRLLLDPIKDYARNVGLTVKVADAILEGVGGRCSIEKSSYSHNLLYDVDRYSGLLNLTNGDVHRNLIRDLISRNYEGQGAGPLLDALDKIDGSLELRIGQKRGSKVEDLGVLVVKMLELVRILRGGMH